MLSFDFLWLVRLYFVFVDDLHDRLLVHLHPVLIIRLKWTASLVVKVAHVHVVVHTYACSIASGLHGLGGVRQV